MKYYKLKHGKWYCSEKYKNKMLFCGDGLIYFDSNGKPSSAFLSDHSMWINNLSS